MNLNTKVVFLVLLQWVALFSNVNSFSAPTQFSSLSTRAFASSQANLNLYSPVSPSSTKPKSKKNGLQMSSSTTTVGSNGDEPMFEPLGKGILRDYKARLPLYASDIKDGLNTQCLAATLFLFFACLSPAVGFGGLFAAATDGAIGTIEMVSSTAGKNNVCCKSIAKNIYSISFSFWV